MFNQLLDDEIKNAEQMILEKNPSFLIADEKEEKEVPFVEQKKEGKEEKKEEKEKTKSELADDINNLEKTLNKQITDKNRLLRLTKKDLLKKIAELLNNGIEKTNPVFEKITIEPIFADEQKKEASFSEGKRKEKNENLINSGAVSLLRLNLLACNLLETLSISLKAKTYDIAVLDGYTEIVKNQSDTLLPIFKEIFLKYQESLSTYINPVNQYLIIMGTSAGSCASKNITEKKKALEKEDIQV